MRSRPPESCCLAYDFWDSTNKSISICLFNLTSNFVTATKFDSIFFFSSFKWKWKSGTSEMVENETFVSGEEREWEEERQSEVWRK